MPLGRTLMELVVRAGLLVKVGAMVHELDFVGADRSELVERLMKAFKNEASQGTPVWVSIEAPSGWGKSRLAHEFYKRLASECQDDGPFWPASIAGAIKLSESSGESAIELCRKRSYPEVLIPAAGSTPAWFWWGIGCHARYGAPVEALRVDLAQFSRLEENGDFTNRWRRNVTVAARVNRELARLINELTKDGVAAAIDKIGDAALRAVGLTPIAQSLSLFKTLGKWGARKARDAYDSRDAGEVSQRIASVDFAEQVGMEVRNLAQGVLPVVILIEDFHLADDTLVALATRLLVAQSKVMLITTSWPNQVDDPTRPAQFLLDRCADYLQRWTTADLLATMQITDRQELAHQLLPQATEEVTTGLAERYSNPLALRLAAQSPALKEALAGRGDPLEVIRQLPREVSELYWSIWKSLPEQLRRLCMLSALSSPTSVSAHRGGGEDRWDRDVVAAAARSIDRLRDDLWPGGRGPVDDMHGWIRLVTESLCRFHEPIQRQIALDAARDSYGNPRQTLSDYLGVLASLLIPTDPDPERALVHARLLVALADGGVSVSDAQRLDAVATVVEHLATLPDSASCQAVIDETTEVLVANSGDSHPTRLRMRQLRARALAQKGDLRQAIDEYSSLCPILRALDPDNPDTLECEYEYAGLLGAIGRITDGLALSRKILEDHNRLFGPNDRRTHSLRAQTADLFGASGMPAKAVTELRGLLRDDLGLLGPHHQDTFSTRRSLANWLGRGGEPGEAVAELRGLVEDQEQALGADDPETLSTRATLAYWMGESGFPASAVAEFDLVLEVKSRLDAVDHPSTFITRGNRAVWLGESGQVHEALSEFDRLLDDQLRILYPDHPDVLTTRSHRANLLVKADVKEAIREFLRLIPDMEAALEPGHQGTFAARDNYVFALVEDGQFDEARAEVRRHLADLARFRDPEHPDIVRTRRRLAALSQRETRYPRNSPCPCGSERKYKFCHGRA